MDSVRWYARVAWARFVCWFKGHDILEDPHARACFRRGCGLREWLY